MLISPARFQGGVCYVRDLGSFERALLIQETKSKIWHTRSQLMIKAPAPGGVKSSSGINLPVDRIRLSSFQTMNGIWR
jgi:hypothetical protein